MTYTEFIIEIENNIAKANCDKLNMEEYEEKQKQIYNQIRAEAIDGFANWLVEQGILGNRCISDGEITDYGKVYAKKIQGTVKGAEMNKETTIDNWVKLFNFEVCSTCKFYNKDFDVCSGEMLPIERAIMINLDGRGNCRDIKDFAKQLKAGGKNEID